MSTPDATVITNPNARGLAIAREADTDDPVPKKSDPVLRVSKIAIEQNYDKVLDDLMQNVGTKIVDIDARVLEGRRLVHYRGFTEFVKSPTVRRRIQEHVKLSHLKEVNERVKSSTIVRSTFREASSAFQVGAYEDETVTAGTVFPTQDTILPTINSPYAKQQTFHDYMTAHVKCWDAATRNPLGKRIVNIVPQFVLSRGLTCDIPEPAHQDAWNAFWKRHDMTLRIKTWLRELMTYGEQFNRHFIVNGKLAQRQVDPCTIWDIVTDPEDLENVKYYYQQYVASSPIIVPGAVQPPSILVIRHIPAAEVDHFTLNKTSSEKRGRSELYAILSWLLRFKEFMNDRILQNKMRAMFALDVSVKGGVNEVNAANQQFQTPPGPGAVAVHNDAIEIDYKNASTDASDAKTDADMILKVIAIGAGVSEQFLGVSSAQTRAGALLQTEPDVKNFENYQQIVEVMLHKTYERLAVAEKLPATKKVFEVSFPSLAAEDRSAKLQDLALMEAQAWIAKERSATMAAREVGITGYDYTTEQEVIRQERAKDPIVMQGFQSVKKEAPDPLELAAAKPAPGSPTSKGGAPKTDKRKVKQTSAEMGYSGKTVSGRGLANTRATLNRSGFTRGTEKASVKGQKSAGAPLRASTWGTAARAASLETRRRAKLARLMQEAERLAHDTPAWKKLDAEITTVRQLLEGHAPEHQG